MEFIFKCKEPRASQAQEDKCCACCVSMASRERALPQHWETRKTALSAGSFRAQVDQAEVTSSSGAGQLMLEGSGQASRLSPVLGSSMERVLKGQTSVSDVAECSTPIIILSPWKLPSGLLQQKPDVVLLYLVNVKLNRNAAGKTAGRLQCPQGILT